MAGRGGVSWETRVVEGSRGWGRVVEGVVDEGGTFDYQWTRGGLVGGFGYNSSGPSSLRGLGGPRLPQHCLGGHVWERVGCCIVWGGW